MSNETDKAGESQTTSQSASVRLTEVLNNYVHELDALANSVPLMMAVAEVVEKDAKKKVDDFLAQHGTPIERNSSGQPIRWEIAGESVHSFRPLDKRHASASIAQKIIPRTFLIALVSQFDAFLGSLIRALFEIQPQWLSVSEKTITYSQVISFADLQEVRSYLIEKEVETILRESHSSHFDWLEKKAAIPLRKDADWWPLFIEITERRNLFVHTGGIISSQYLRVCGDHKVNFDNFPFKQPPKVSEELNVTSSYFRSAYRILYEIGVKLTHTLWRKLRKAEIKEADAHLSDLCYEVIVAENYKLAQRLLDFATETTKKHSSEELKRTLVINRAQSYKWGGNESRAKQILDSEDWSALSTPFQLCVAVLRDDFDKACTVMQEIGSEGRVSKADYRHWPVFKVFRESQEFQDAYQRIFGEPYTQLVTTEKEEDA